MKTDRTSLFKAITGAITLVGALGLASQASAYTFDVCESGGFTVAADPNDALNGIVAPDNGACINTSGGNTGVEWFGGSNPKSSVVIDFKAFSLDLDLDLDSDMDMDIIATISQNNVEIFPADSIDGAQGFPYTHLMQGSGNFQIADATGAVVLGPPEATSFFSIEHTETRNFFLLSNCGPQFTVTAPCEDRWVFDIFPPPGSSVQFLSADPDAAGFIFTASFDLVVDAPNVVVGNTVYTAEPGASSIDVKLSISSRRIPEPGTLVLLGLGLAGLGVATRRKRG